MSHNIKTFCELQDINFFLPVVITLNKYGHQDLHINVTINDHCIFDTKQADSYVVLSTSVDLLQPIKIKVSMTNKTFGSSDENAVNVSSITIDGINVIPTYTHVSKFSDSFNVTSSSYISWPADWTLDIDQPFYQWLHLHSGQGWLLHP